MSYMTKSFEERQERYYDHHADKFDKRGFFYSRKNRNHYKKIVKVIKAVKRHKPKKVLELGAGTGLHAYWLMKDTEAKIEYN